MTVLNFYFNKNGKITGFCVSGHSGYANEGEDIVCAAITGNVRMLEYGVVQVLGEKRGLFSVDVENTAISFEMPENIAESETTQLDLLMNMFFRSASALEKEFKQYISVEERRL